MKYNYEGLFARLKKLGWKRSDLMAKTGLSSKTIAKLGKGEALSQKSLAKLALALEASVADLVQVASSPLLSRLQEEMTHKISGGIYHELQIHLTYNSNHMEGSTLSEEQTRQIFETHTIGPDSLVPIDDLIETINHFRAIDFCIAQANTQISQDFIKKLHGILKANTRDARLDWFQVGDYKIRPNVVGGRETSSPQTVSKDMANLLKSYLHKPTVNEEDIIDFHYRFECIHPFQDGNGRVGRLIMLKECLAHDLVPIFIADRKKYFYYRGLQEYPTNPEYLIDTCLDGQDQFKKRLDYFQIPYD